MDGWVVLDRLKHDPTTRHIPVHVISVDDSWQRGMRLGAFAFLKKPVSKKTLDDAFAHIKGFLESEVRELLIVEDNAIERGSIVAAVGNSDIHTTTVGSAAEALEAPRVPSVRLHGARPESAGHERPGAARDDQARAQPPAPAASWSTPGGT